jgi:hypothetical protein
MKPPITKLSDLGIDLDKITDPSIRQAITLLLNLVEEVSLDNDRLRAENQALCNEIARLKGEQGKPDIRGKNRSDISSEGERKTDRKPPKAKGSKNKRLTITRTEVVPINQADLPADAVSKGYETSIIQDLVITTEVIELKRETYYSPSEHHSFTAPMPAGYAGAFGPRLKSVVILLKTLGLPAGHYGTVRSSESTYRAQLTECSWNSKLSRQKADIFKAVYPALPAYRRYLGRVKRKSP